MNAPDIARFRFALMRFVSEAQRAGIDAETCATIWDDAAALCHELQIARLGVKPDTIQQAETVARLDRELRGLEPDEITGAIMDRLRISRPTVFRLRKVARSLTRDETA